MNFLEEWKDYFLLVVGGALTALGTVATTIFSNRKDIDELRVTVDYLIKSKTEHEAKIDSSLSEIRSDIKNLLSRK